MLRNPISPGTVIRTSRLPEDSAIGRERLEEATQRCRWGVKGTVLDYHYGDLCDSCTVQHEDGSTAVYFTTELMSYQVVVSGITGYPTRDHRFEACCRFLKNASYSRVSVYLADTSPPEIQAELVRLGATLVHCPDTSYTGKKIASLQVAVKSGATAILITEMEKDGLLPYLSDICGPILEGRADMVIPERTPTSWASYPKEFEIERFALDQIRQFTGWYFDTMLGAFAIHRDLAPRFLACRETMWTWLHVPRLEIIKEHPDRVVGVPVDFLYPPDQKKAEEGNRAFHLKRLEQLGYSLIRPLQVVYGG